MTIVSENISLENYRHFLAEIVSLVQCHRVQAVQSVQTISNQLYWNIGELIINKQQEYGWGKSIVEKLSVDLPQYVGDGASWSPRNLRLMRQLVYEYSNVKQPVSHLNILNQADSELPNMKPVASEVEIVKQLVSQVPWGQNIMIIQRVKDHKARLFYLQSTIRNKYSRAVLLHQINADAYSNYLLHKSQHNFETALPEHFLEQAKESIKSVYSLDFLDINKPVISTCFSTTGYSNAWWQ